MKIIDRFDGEYNFLSNFYMAEVIFEGQIYPSSEHAFQAAKSLDPIDRTKIRKTKTPGNSKRMGREIKLRHDWDNIKYDVMLTIVRDKFTRHKDLAEKLLATENAVLIEGNTWGDRTWGVVNGKGKNWLGKILMQVRNEIS